MKNLGYVLVSSLLSLLLLSSCQTAPKRFDDVSQGQWKTKVLVKDKIQSKSHIVNLDINAIKSQKLRLDVTLPSGYHVASLTLVDNKVEYVLPREKKFYKGQATEGSLKPLLNVSLEPSVVYNIIFDIPIENKNWTCTKNSNGQIKECENKKNKTTIFWDDKNPTTKLVKIDSQKAELQMRFVSFKPQLRQSKNLFSLKIPKSFTLNTLQ